MYQTLHVSHVQWKGIRVSWAFILIMSVTKNKTACDMHSSSCLSCIHPWPLLDKHQCDYRANRSVEEHLPHRPLVDPTAAWEPVNQRQDSALCLMPSSKSCYKASPPGWLCPFPSGAGSPYPQLVRHNTTSGARPENVEHILSRGCLLFSNCTA